MEDEDLTNPSERQRIEGTVLQILKASDLETATASTVLAAAAETLGVELSGLAQRRFVQQIIDSFLLSNAASILGTTSPAKDCDGGGKIVSNAERRCKQQQHLLESGGVVVQGSYAGSVVCKLTNRRWVTVHEHQGATLVSIGDFVSKDGKIVPHRAPNAGITLSTAQWSSFRNCFSSIEEAIVKLESRLGSEAAAKPCKAAHLKNSVADSVAEQSLAGAMISNLEDVVRSPVKRKHTEGESEITSAVLDSASAHAPIKEGASPSLRTFRPIKRQQTESNATLSANALPSLEHIIVERKDEEAWASGSVPSSESQENAPAERYESEAQISLPIPTFDAPGQMHGTAKIVYPMQPASAGNKVTEADVPFAGPTIPTKGNLHPKRLIPIQTARFDGKNYHSWRHQMELFLNQLDIAYVLNEPRPSTSSNKEVSFDKKVKVQRWIDVDYLCRHNILNSLSDSLFQLYSQKVQSARELWEELSLTYNDDFGTKRSQINKYVHFQFVDGASIVGQVLELNRIANSITASGIWIDENFHVSVIISKLPPSWKEFRVQLMHEEFVPFNMLMHRLQAEEDYRNRNNREHNNVHLSEPKVDCRPVLRKKEKIKVCYSCRQAGHISKDCRNKKFDTKERSDNDGIVSPNTGDKIFVEVASNTE